MKTKLARLQDCTFLVFVTEQTPFQSTLSFSSALFPLLSSHNPLHVSMKFPPDSPGFRLFEGAVKSQLGMCQVAERVIRILILDDDKSFVTGINLLLL